MPLYKKIREARKQLKLNQSDFARLVGVNQRDISKLEAGETKFVPNEYIQFLYKKGFDVNSLFDDDIPLSMLNNKINEVSETRETYLLRTDDKLINQAIPLFNLEATAGLVELFQQVNEKTPIDFLSIPNLPKCDGAVFVTGDSMYPLLKSGDIIIYKQIHNIKDGLFWGEMYLVSVQMDDEEYVTVKYVQKSDLGDKYIKLVSQNSHHAPKDVLISRIRALAMVKASVRINAMQ